MKSSLGLTILVIVGLATGIGEQHVFAEEELEELVVTARKRVEQLSEVPVSITTFNSESILDKGVTELNQLEKFAPNTVQTNFGQGSSGHASVFMRGIGLQDHIITTDPGSRDLPRWRLLGPQYGCKLGSGKS